jgi:hypothetical protein
VKARLALLAAALTALAATLGSGPIWP